MSRSIYRRRTLGPIRTTLKSRIKKLGINPFDQMRQVTRLRQCAASLCFANRLLIR